MDRCHHKHKPHDKKRHWHLSHEESHDHHESSDHHDESSHHHESSDHHHESSDHHHGHDKKDHDSCVKDILKAILHAQKKVEKKQQHRELSCCKEAIHELLGKKKMKPKKNTIPFILYCNDCEPFKGTGVSEYKCHTKKEKFFCISSFIFKIKDIHDDCATLELLVFKQDHQDSTEYDHKCDLKDHCSPCCQIDNKKVANLVSTGICLTVELSCFCAISCLPPVCL